MTAVSRIAREEGESAIKMFHRDCPSNTIICKEVESRLKLEPNDRPVGLSL